MNSPIAQEKKKVRVGILGAGSVTELYHLPVLKNVPGVDVTWLCDTVLDRARRLGRMFSVPRAVARLDECPNADIVLMAIPVGLRRGPLRHAFGRGWHVLCEKPFAVSTKEHDEILEEASAAGVHVGVGLMRRFYRANLLARQVIESRVLGDVVHVRAAEGNRQAATGRGDEWYQGDRDASGGGMFIERGIHLVDMLLTILGAEGFSVQDCSQKLVNGLEMETRVAGGLTRPDRSEVTFRLAVSQLDDLSHGMVIEFPEAALRLGSFPNEPVRLCTKRGLPIADLESESGAREVYQAFYLEWTGFIEQCATGRPSAIDAASARLTTAFVEECYRSSDRPGAVPPLGEPGGLIGAER